MSPQPTDIQSIAGRLLTAERIQRLHDQQMLLNQQRTAVAGEDESTKGESHVADTKQTENESARCNGASRTAVADEGARDVRGKVRSRKTARFPRAKRGSSAVPKRAKDSIWT